MASVVTLPFSADANSAAPVVCSEPDRWEQPVENAVRAITASAAGNVASLFTIAPRLDRGPSGRDQDTSGSDIQRSEGGEGNVAHHEPRQHQ